MILRFHSQFDLGFVRRFALLFLVALCLVPCFCRAQSALQPKWVKGPIHYPNLVAYSRDGKYVAVGGEGFVQLYTVTTGLVRSLPTLDLQHAVSIQFSPDAKTVAIVGTSRLEVSGIVQFWDVEKGLLTGSILPENFPQFKCAAYSPDGKTIAIGGNFSPERGFLSLYDVQSKKLTKSLDINGFDVTGASFSKDGSELADVYSTANGLFAEVWSVKKAKRIQTLTSYPFSQQLSISLSPDGLSLAMAGAGINGSTVQTVNVANGKVIHKFPIAAYYAVNAISFSPDGRYLADCGEGTTAVLEIWDPSTGKSLAMLDGQEPLELMALAISPDSKHLANVGISIDGSYPGVEARVEIVDFSTLSVGKSFRTAPWDAGSAMAYSPDGTTIAVGIVERTKDKVSSLVRLLDSASGSEKVTLNTSATKVVRSLAYSPDGKSLVVGGVTDSGTQAAIGVLEVWDLSSGQVTKLSASATNSVNSVSFTPDGKTLVAAGTSADNRGVIDLWNMATGKLISTIQAFDTGAISATSLSPDGGSILLGGLRNGVGTVEIWDLKTGSAIRSFSTGSFLGINSVAFSPNGKTVTSTGSSTIDFGRQTGKMPWDQTEIWDLTSADNFSKYQLAFVSSDIQYAAYSPDGGVLFSTMNSAVNPGIYATSTVNGWGLWGDIVGPVYNIVFSPSGLQLCFFQGGGIVMARNPLMHPVSLSSFTVAPLVVKHGQAVTGTVTLSAPAPKGGLTVTPYAQYHNVNVPDSFVIPEGKSVWTFKIDTSFVTSTNMAPIQVSAPEAGTLSSSFTIDLPTIASLSVSSSVIKGGTTAVATITLSSIAPPGGLPIQVEGFSPLVFGPTNVLVPGGTKTLTFEVPTPKVAKPTLVTIAAVIFSSSQLANFTIN